MAFSDETDHRSRWFNCSWGPRAEAAEEIARRLQALARDLRHAEPDLNALWPYFSDRAIRVTDPGPADEMAVEDLGRLIDRRARFDPPQLPAPVGPWGYSISLAGPPPTDLTRNLDVSVHAGSTKGQYGRNVCVLRLHIDALVWRSAESGLAILRALVRAWEPDEAGAYADYPRCGDGPYNGSPPVRPWLTWKRDGAGDEFYEFTNVGEPDFVSKEMGGELRLWR